MKHHAMAGNHNKSNVTNHSALVESAMAHKGATLMLVVHLHYGVAMAVTPKALTRHKSMLPSLLGLNPMREQQGIIDTNALTFCMPGTGDSNLEAALPPDTDRIQCELSPSGHIVMLCCDWKTLERQESQGGLQLEREITLYVN